MNMLVGQPGYQTDEMPAALAERVNSALPTSAPEKIQIANRLPKDEKERKPCPLLDDLPIFDVRLSGVSALLNAITQTNSILEERVKQFNTLLQKSTYHNIIVRVDSDNYPLRDKLYEQVWEELKPHIPTISVTIPQVINFNTLQTPEKLRQYCIPMYQGIGAGVLRDMKSSLKLMQDRSLAGTSKQGSLDSSVREYTYFRHQISRDRTAIRHREENTTSNEYRSNFRAGVYELVTTYKTKHFYEHDQEELRRLQKTTHTLYESNRFPILDKMPKPPEVEHVIRNYCPAWMHGYMRIVAGKMAVEEIKEIDLSRKRCTEYEEKEDVSVVIRRLGTMQSPGLIFGSTTLMGWAGHDLQSPIPTAAHATPMKSNRPEDITTAWLKSWFSS